MKAKNIDEVISHLEDIIQHSRKEENTFGYFAALYQKVTIKVKEKLGQGYFDDDDRMEKLDVIFANRYLKAYSDFQAGKIATKSWEKAFHLAKDKQLIVLQHLLLGMNAHINLDLGIAASEVSSASTISSLQTDFNKINDILSTLVDEVQTDLSKIWPRLLAVLRFVKKIDNYLIDFSMTVARDGAWELANNLAGKSEEEKARIISIRDEDVANLAKAITPQGFIEKLIFGIVRFGEKGNPSFKIQILKNK